MRARNALALVALALGLSACERGCLATWLADRSASPGVGGEGPRGSTRADASSPFDLGGTDCSDGLARCVAGHVEVSLPGHVPHPCVAPPERPGACTCGWQTVGACSAGCVKEGLEVLATAEIARDQLCNAAEPVIRPLRASEAAVVAPICADERVSCEDGVVRVCAVRGQPARAIVGCVNGCALGVAVEPGDLSIGNGPAAILCRRAHAERR